MAKIDWSSLHFYTCPACCKILCSRGVLNNSEVHTSDEGRRILGGPTCYKSTSLAPASIDVLLAPPAMQRQFQCMRGEQQRKGCAAFPKSEQPWVSSLRMGSPFRLHFLPFPPALSLYAFRAAASSFCFCLKAKSDSSSSLVLPAGFFKGLAFPPSLPGMLNSGVEAATDDRRPGATFG